jgi:DNA-binding CsgD family transcriptional regulator
LDTEQIAQRLTISRHTVRSHIEKMRLKYKKRSIAGIVAIALRQGWVE